MYHYIPGGGAIWEGFSVENNDVWQRDRPRGVACDTWDPHMIDALSQRINILTDYIRDILTDYILTDSPIQAAPRYNLDANPQP